MARVTINESVLRWALERSDRTAESLERKYPRIVEWLTGVSQPTLRQLESLAKTTMTPLGFFFLNEPPVDRLPIPYFRTVVDGRAGGPSPDLLETIQLMQLRQEWMREFLIDEDQEPLSFVGSASEGDDPVRIAEHIRTLLSFQPSWAAQHKTWTDALRALREAIETAGILVTVNGVVGNSNHRKLDTAEFRGFVLVDEYAPLVFINGSDSKAAQMFTLGHELAHVLVGSSAAFDLRQLQPADDAGELFCDRVAAEFLVPRTELMDYWASAHAHSEPFQSIARRFKVSTLVAARRALDLNLIDRSAFFVFYDEYERDERRRRSVGSDGGDFYANQNLRVGRRLATAVIRATRKGTLLYSEAYRLTGLHGKTFDGYAQYLERGGRS